ncbi:MAG: RDD family protein [Deltaproteobacteria bacterium]|nr:MAG: RDD family protein [Deltaproteobacteria bacterium]
MHHRCCSLYGSRAHPFNWRDYWRPLYAYSGRLAYEALEFNSLGKRALKLSVVMTENPTLKIDYATSAKRNWMFALGPIMLFFFFIPIIGWIIDILLGIALFISIIIEIIKTVSDENGIRLGDKMAGTMVIEK